MEVPRSVTWCGQRPMAAASLSSQPMGSERSDRPQFDVTDLRAGSAGDSPCDVVRCSRRSGRSRTMVKQPSRQQQREARRSLEDSPRCHFRQPTWPGWTDKQASGARLSSGSRESRPLLRYPSSYPCPTPLLRQTRSRKDGLGGRRSTWKDSPYQQPAFTKNGWTLRTL